MPYKLTRNRLKSSSSLSIPRKLELVESTAHPDGMSESTCFRVLESFPSSDDKPEPNWAGVPSRPRLPCRLTTQDIVLNAYPSCRPPYLMPSHSLTKAPRGQMHSSELHVLTQRMADLPPRHAPCVRCDAPRQIHIAWAKGTGRRASVENIS